MDTPFIEDPVTISAMIPMKLLDEVRQLAITENMAYAEIVREALKLWVATTSARHKGKEDESRSDLLPRQPPCPG